MKKMIFSYLALSILSISYSLAQDSSSTKRATFSMYCYWTGEATLGSLPGVKKTKIGHLSGSEIVEVLYDPQKTDIAKMSKALKKQNSFYSVLYRTDEEKKYAQSALPKAQIKKSKEQEVDYIAAKHSLQVVRPDIYALDLSEEQAIKLNTWAHFHQSKPMPDILTSQQKKKLLIKK